MLGLLADKKRARDVRLARVEYMSRRRGTSTSLVLEPPSSVHSVKSFVVNFSRIAGRDRRPGIAPIVVVAGSFPEVRRKRRICRSRGDRFRASIGFPQVSQMDRFDRSVVGINLGIECRSQWHRATTWQSITEADGQITVNIEIILFFRHCSDIFFTNFLDFRVVWKAWKLIVKSR